MGIAYLRLPSLFHIVIILALLRHTGINELILLEVLASQAPPLRTKGIKILLGFTLVKRL